MVTFSTDRFEECLHEVSEPLRKIARRFAGRSVVCDASDLYQEMVIFLWQAFEQGKFLDCNTGYLLKGCEFHLRNTLRKWKNQDGLMSLEEPLGDEGDTLKDNLAQPLQPFCEQLENQLTIDEILSNGYSESVKRVFALLLQGYTTREVGEKLGISHVRVVKLKQELAREYQKECAMC